MTNSTTARIALGLIGFLVTRQPAHAAPMQVMESNPSAEAVMDGTATEFFVRFDGPVDHAGSRLLVLQHGKIVEILHPRLQSEPNVLYSGVRRLVPGSYTLQWTTRSMADRAVSHGDIPFTVKGP